jgi:hypothetical protein
MDLSPVSDPAFRDDQERYANVEASFDAYERAREREDGE